MQLFLSILNIDSMSASKENFVKTIYNYEKNASMNTRPGSIAKALGITSAAATDMSKKLAERNLVQYQKYRELSLTDEGEKMALQVIRKHRLWETFLFRILNLSLYEIHEEAELLEHMTSDFLAEKISTYLGNPKVDPHGDPIPDTSGDVLDHPSQLLLSNASEGENFEIIRLFGQDKEFFTFCKENYLVVGTRVEVTKQYESNKMTEVRVIGMKMVLNQEITNRIYVKRLAPNY